MASLATRHECPHTRAVNGVHTAGNGAPKRKKCALCGGALFILRGVWAVYTWRGDNGYRLADAHQTFTREAKADGYATTNGTYVVRWVDESALTS